MTLKGRLAEAGLHRLQGQFLAALPDPGRLGEAKAAFQRAVQIASIRQGWELRAATISLGSGAARASLPTPDLVAPVRSWFTEVFETPDFTRSKTLLEALR